MGSGDGLRSFAFVVIHEQVKLRWGFFFFFKKKIHAVIQVTNRGRYSIVHERETMTFDHLPFISSLGSIWYVGADPQWRRCLLKMGCGQEPRCARISFSPADDRLMYISNCSGHTQSHTHFILPAFFSLFLIHCCSGQTSLSIDNKPGPGLPGLA